jgi:hypothetical protein
MISYKHKTLMQKRLNTLIEITKIPDGQFDGVGAVAKSIRSLVYFSSYATESLTKVYSGY